jgi:cytochrome c-type biogenesis protein CcmI
MSMGTVLSLVLIAAAVAFVLAPLFRRDAGVLERRASALSEEEDLASQQEMAMASLKDLEDDRATGKIGDSDYEDVKARLTRRAVEVMKRQDELSAKKAPARPAIVPDPPPTGAR